MLRFVFIALVPFSALAQEAAPAAAAPQGSPLASLIPLILIAVIFYFFMIRPQMKRHKELQSLQAGLKKGDEVITSGGIVGKFVRDGDNGLCTIEIASGVEVKLVKSTIASVVGKIVTAPSASTKKKDARVKNDNIVPDKENVANDN